MTTHFLVHDAVDTVGVVVVEDVQAGQTLTGWLMDSDGTVEITALDPIPLGHKIALNDIEEGATMIKYGYDIGKVITPVKKGGHVHVHNAKTKKW